MNKTQLKALAKETAQGLNSEKEIAALTKLLRQSFYEKALEAELDDHLGYDRHDAKQGTNSRNGYTKKTLKTDEGELEINTPRDRQSEFEPQIIKKRQTRTPALDSKILSLYAKGMTTRTIVDTLSECYDTDISPTLISKVTDGVLELVTQWQSRPLDEVYAIVYLDCIVLKIRQDKQVINKAVYLALGVNMEGHKELLGIWITENEHGFLIEI